MMRVKRVNGGLIDTSCNVDRQSHGEACQPSRHTPLFLFSALLAPSGDFFFFFSRRSNSCPTHGNLQNDSS